MTTTDYIKFCLESSKGWAFGLISDMLDSPLTQPTPKGGNHPTWVLGHLVHSESQLFDVFMNGRENRFPELQELFGMGSEPTTEQDKYPTMESLMAKHEEIRAAALAHLETLSDEDLDQASHAPEDFGDMFGTVGKCYAAMCSHVSFHAGQVADARRAAGKGPLMA